MKITKCGLMFVNQAVQETLLFTISFFLLGYWLMHCHLLYHAENGMGLVFKVGEDSDMPPIPDGFPVCRSWIN